MTDSNYRKVLFDLVAEIEESNGSVSLLGAKIANPKDLAKAAEVVRSPRYETLHYLFTRNGVVKGTTAISCRLAGASTTFTGPSSEAFLKDLIKRAKSIEADTYYLLHNHPSGMPMPSKQDVYVTQKLVEEITELSPIKFGGHVVINSTDFSVIDENGEILMEPINYSSYNISDIRSTNSFFEKVVRSPYDFALIAKELQASEKSFFMIGLNAKNMCNCLFEVSYEIMEDKEHISQNIRDWSIASGVHQFGLVNFNTEKLPELYKYSFINKLAKSSYLLDVITSNGKSLREQGLLLHKRESAKRFAEEIHDYSSDYEQLSKPKTISTETQNNIKI